MLHPFSENAIWDVDWGGLSKACFRWGPDPPREGALRDIMCLTPWAMKLTRPVFAPAGHNKFCTAETGDATSC